MKHLTVLLICILSFGACRQKSVIDFDVSYKPNSIYSISSESIIKTVILFQSSHESIEKDSIEKQSKTEKSQKQIVTLKTNSMNPNQSFSWEMKIDSFTINDKSIIDSITTIENQIKGLIIEGSIDKNKVLTIETLISNKIDDKFSSEVKNKADKIFGQISFPSAKMSIGDEIIQVSPFELPSQYSGNIRIKINSKYILKSIKDNFASFEILQNVDSLNIAGKDFEIKGRGTGYCEYDIRNKYITKYQTSTNTDMKLKMYGQIMKVNSNSIYNQETSLKN